MMSPSSTSAIGPPTAASGETCPIDAPLEAPLKRPSVIRATLEPGIYYVTGDVIIFQIIVINELDSQENKALYAYDEY